MFRFLIVSRKSTAVTLEKGRFSVIRCSSAEQSGAGSGGAKLMAAFCTGAAAAHGFHQFVGEIKSFFSRPDKDLRKVEDDVNKIKELLESFSSRYNATPSPARPIKPIVAKVSETETTMASLRARGLSSNRAVMVVMSREFEAIQMLRETEGKPNKKQEFLEKKIETEVAVARKNAKTNKRKTRCDGGTRLITSEQQREALKKAHADMSTAQEMSKRLEIELKENMAQKEDQDEHIATPEKGYLNAQLEQELKDKGELYAGRVRVHAVGIEEQLKDRLQAFKLNEEHNQRLSAKVDKLLSETESDEHPKESDDEDGEDSESKYDEMDKLEKQYMNYTFFD